MTTNSIEDLEGLLAGLGQSPKRLPSKYFYDRRGSELFEQICNLEEYYLTRTEISIMEEHMKDILILKGSMEFRQTIDAQRAEHYKWLGELKRKHERKQDIMLWVVVFPTIAAVILKII